MATLARERVARGREASERVAAPPLLQCKEKGIRLCGDSSEVTAVAIDNDNVDGKTEDIVSCFYLID